MTPTDSGHRIRLAGVHYRVRWARELATWDVEVGPGQIHHVRAPNGAGKTTWLRAALGLVPARWDLNHLGPEAPGFRRSVRYVPAGSALALDLPLGAAVALLAKRAGITPEDCDSALDRWQLTKQVTLHGRHLSTGQCRSALLAVALAGPGCAVLLDEPTDALDDGRRRTLVDAVADQQGRGSAFLVVGHDPGPWVELGAEVTDAR